MSFDFSRIDSSIGTLNDQMREITETGDLTDPAVIQKMQDLMTKNYLMTTFESNLKSTLFNICKMVMQNWPK